MEPLLVGAGTALWLGVLTSISPCPLASNIAAISFNGKRLSSPFMVVISSLLYTLGRVLAYTLVGGLVVGGLLSIPGLSYFLQRYMNLILGPLLILAGMFLLGLLEVKLSTSLVTERLEGRLSRGGLWSALLLGMLLALSFCPVSAALYFGSLIPLSVLHQSHLILPALYGVGTALPVLLVGGLALLGAQVVGQAYQRLVALERYARLGTGGVFVLVGIYYGLKHSFGVI